MKYFVFLFMGLFLLITTPYLSYGNKNNATNPEIYSDYSMLEIDAHKLKYKIKKLSSIKKTLIKSRRHLNDFKQDKETTQIIDRSKKLLNIYFNTLTIKDKNKFNFESFGMTSAFKRERQNILKILKKILLDLEHHNSDTINILKKDLNNFIDNINRELPLRSNKLQNAMSSSHAKDGINAQQHSFNQFCELLSEENFKNSINTILDNFDLYIDSELNNYSNELKEKESKISKLAIEVEKRQNNTTNNFFLNLIAGLFSVFILWLIRFTKKKIDEIKTVNFLKKSSGSTSYKFRSTHFLASHLNMTENKIRQICNSSRKISRNSKKKETWKLKE